MCISWLVEEQQVYFGTLCRDDNSYLSTGSARPRKIVIPVKSHKLS